MSSDNELPVRKEGLTCREVSETGDGRSDHEAVTPPSAVLLLGAPADGERESACVDFMRIGDPDAIDALYVDLTRRRAEPYEQWRLIDGELPANLKILSVGNFDRSASGQAVESAAMPSNRWVEPLEGPGNLTRLGVKITTVLDQFSASDNQIAVCFNSLTTLLHYHDPATVFKFFNVLKSHLFDARALLHVHAEPGAHDEQTIAKLGPLFDEVIDLAGDDHSS